MPVIVVVVVALLLLLLLVLVLPPLPVPSPLALPGPAHVPDADGASCEARCARRGCAGGHAQLKAKGRKRCTPLITMRVQGLCSDVCVSDFTVILPGVSWHLYNYRYQLRYG